MAKIFWDTNLFIYLFEDNKEFAPAVAELRERMLRNSDELITSYLTLAEIQVRPNNLGEKARAKMFANTLARTVSLVPFDGDAVAAYVSFREKTKVKGPDAIQLACAAVNGASFFVTNDRQLLRARISDFDMFIITPENVPI